MNHNLDEKENLRARIKQLEHGKSSVSLGGSYLDLGHVAMEIF